MVLDSWRRLQTSCENRRTLLASSYTLQKFHADRRELETWVADMMSRMAESQDGEEAERAEELLQLHQVRAETTLWCPGVVFLKPLLVLYLLLKTETAVRREMYAIFCRVKLC